MLLHVHWTKTIKNPIPNNNLTQWVAKFANLFKITPFTKQLKSYEFEYFQICKDLCALECDNLKHQTPFKKMIWPNILLWINIVFTTPRTEHISCILAWHFMNFQRTFSLTRHSSNGLIFDQWKKVFETFGNELFL